MWDAVDTLLHIPRETNRKCEEQAQMAAQAKGNSGFIRKQYSSSLNTDWTSSRIQTRARSDVAKTHMMARIMWICAWTCPILEWQRATFHGSFLKTKNHKIRPLWKILLKMECQKNLMIGWNEYQKSNNDVTSDLRCSLTAGNCMLVLIDHAKNWC